MAQHHTTDAKIHDCDHHHHIYRRPQRTSNTCQQQHDHHAAHRQNTTDAFNYSTAEHSTARRQHHANDLPQQYMATTHITHSTKHILHAINDPTGKHHASHRTLKRNTPAPLQETPPSAPGPHAEDSGQTPPLHTHHQDTNQDTHSKHEGLGNTLPINSDNQCHHVQNTTTTSPDKATFQSHAQHQRKQQYIAPYENA